MGELTKCKTYEKTQAEDAVCPLANMNTAVDGGHEAWHAWNDGNDPGNACAPVDTVVIPVCGLTRSDIQIWDGEDAFLNNVIVYAQQTNHGT
jgi:hypothetical protein